MEKWFKQNGPFYFFYRLLHPYRLSFFAFVCCSLTSSIFDGISITMLVPLMGNLLGVEDYHQMPGPLKKITGLVDHFPPEQQVFFAISFIISAVIARAMMATAANYLGYWLSAKATIDLRSRAVGLLTSVGIEFYYRSQAGRLAELAIGHTGKVANVVQRSVQMIVRSATLVVLLFMLLMLSWSMTLISIGVAALIWFSTTRYIARLGHLADKAQETNQTLTALFYETVAGIQVIKSFARETEQADKLVARVEEQAELQRQLKFKNYLVFVITEIMGLLAMGALFVFALIWLELDSRQLLVHMLPFIYVLTRILPLLRRINEGRGELVSLWPFLDIVRDLLDTTDKPSIKNGTLPFTGLKTGLEFRNVDFTYTGNDQAALEKVDISFPKDRTTAIVGSSGSGKSTIVNLLLRLHDPQGGAVLVDDTPLAELRLEQYLAKVGIVSQDTFIFHDTVENNIAFGAVGQPSHDEIVQAARRGGADEFIQALPQGYQTLLGDRGVTLSGGQRQRLAISRAILKDPEILILDEATSALDRVIEEQIRLAIAEFSRGRTVILIAHRLSTIRSADQIVVMKEGRVAEVGDEKSLLDRGGEYYRLVQGTKTQTV